MSFYTVFDAETKVTSTTTANLLAATDPVLIHSSALSRKAQTTAGAIASLWPVTLATSGTTGTLLPPYGVSIITPGTTTQTWQLSTATVVGQSVTIIYGCTSTSSQNAVSTGSTATMTIASTETYAGITLTFNGVPKAYYELTAVTVSTATGIFLNPTVWAVTGRSAAGTLCT